MKPTPRDLFVPGLLALGALLSGCAPIATPPAGGPQAWIDAPLPSSQLPLAPYEVVSHANSTDGIASFELSVNGQVYSSDTVPAPEYGQTLAYIKQPWNPPAPGTYLLSVRAADMQGSYGQTIDVEVTVGEVAVVLPETGTPTTTPAPTEDAGACTFTALVKLFCRTGPGGDYPDIDSFTPGQMAPVVGMSSDGNYWYVTGPLSGRMCTVPMGDRFGQTSGDCSQQPVFTPIPLPPTATPSPTPCTPGGVAVPGC